MQDAYRFDRIMGLATRGETLPSPAERQRIRLAARVTQSELADVLGVHSVTVSRWETGDLQPSGRKAADYRAFLTLARSNERRSVNMEAIGQVLEIDPPGMLIMGSPLEGNAVVEAVLMQLRALGAGNVPLVYAEEGVKRYNDPAVERRVLLQYLSLHNFATYTLEDETVPADLVDVGAMTPATRQAHVVTLVAVYSILPKGVEALAKIEALG